MKPRIWKSCGGTSAVFVLGAMSVLSAQGTDALEGTWVTQVMVRDCQTGTVLRMFPALNTFNRGETMIDTTTGASASARTPGLGKWEKTGAHTYAATSLAFLFSSTGVWTGTQKLMHVIEVQGDESAFRSTVEISDIGGNTVITGCATAVGKRL